MLYFNGFHPDGNDQIWVYNGASGSVTPLATDQRYLWPTDLISYDGRLFFTAETAAHGGELFYFDGADVQLAADIFPGADGAWPYLTIQHGGKLFFAANDQQLYSFEFIYASIEGNVLQTGLTDGNGNPIPPTPLVGIEVRLSIDNNHAATSSSAEDGSYAFTRLTPERSYKVTAVSPPYPVDAAAPRYTFLPSSYEFSDMPRSQMAPFFAREVLDVEARPSTMDMSITETTPVVPNDQPVIIQTDEATIEILAGALTNETVIQVGTFTELPPGAPVGGLLVYFGPPGTTFAAPVKITVPFTEADADAVGGPENLRLLRFSESTGLYQ